MSDEELAKISDRQREFCEKAIRSDPNSFDESEQLAIQLALRDVPTLLEEIGRLKVEVGRLNAEIEWDALYMSACDREFHTEDLNVIGYGEWMNQRGFNLGE